MTHHRQSSCCMLPNVCIMTARSRTDLMAVHHGIHGLHALPIIPPAAALTSSHLQPH